MKANAGGNTFFFFFFFLFKKKSKKRKNIKCAPSTDLDYLYDRFECEHTCWDPKDGELCLNRVKPEETLVEARRGSDVQIDLRIWV